MAGRSLVKSGVQSTTTPDESAFSASTSIAASTGSKRALRTASAMGSESAATVE